MAFRIWKEFHFSASHQLTHLQPGHPCARLHGHNYTVAIELSAPATHEHGFVLDYNALKPFGSYVDNTLDHRHLNDVLGSPHATTAEHLARHLFAVATSLLPEGLVSAVRVQETPKTCAEYRP